MLIMVVMGELVLYFVACPRISFRDLTGGVAGRSSLWPAGAWWGMMTLGRSSRVKISSAAINWRYHCGRCA